jgi:hypothetical protein
MAKPKLAGKKAPGLLSFVVWRQFFMVLAAPGIATAAIPNLPPDTSFIVVLVVAALPALIHGQLWKWSYDWAGYGHPTLRNLRIGQVVSGVAHSALAGWTLATVASGAVPWEGAGFYYGLTIAGAIGGIWETVRPLLELMQPEPPPPAKTVVPPQREASPIAAPRSDGETPSSAGPQAAYTAPSAASSDEPDPNGTPPTAAPR